MLVLPQIFLQTPPNVQGLRDIKPPLEVSQSLLPYILMGTLILVAIVGIAWLYFRKRHQTQPPPPAEVNTQPPHEIALEQLNALEVSSYDMEVYHIQISHVIREYIAARYQIPALELTTTGLLQQMVRAQISDLYVECIQQFLAKCDKVKFTTYQPEASEAEARMSDARWFVDETKTPIV